MYVYRISLELITDHKPLEVIYRPKSKLCARIERWVLRLSFASVDNADLALNNSEYPAKPHPIIPKY